MSLKERIENHLGLAIGGFLVAGFIAGFSAYGTIESIAGKPSGQVATVDWQESARKNGWVAREECPSFPISLKISSPGDQSLVEVVSSFSDSSRIRTDLVIRSLRPVADDMDVGVVFNEEGSGNFYVSFPTFQVNDNRSTFRANEDQFWTPFLLSGKGSLNLWALVVDDETSIGKVFSSLEQVEASNDTVVLSPKISVRLQAKAGEH